MLRKICPCSGCGQANMCVSYDTFKFYCNRCLPHFVRNKWDWVRDQPETKAEPTSATEKKSPNKSISKKK